MINIISEKIPLIYPFHYKKWFIGVMVGKDTVLTQFPCCFEQISKEKNFVNCGWEVEGQELVIFWEFIWMS